MRIIGFLCYCILGGLLAHLGHPYVTWEFWAIIGIVAIIDLTSYLSSK